MTDWAKYISDLMATVNAYFDTAKNSVYEQFGIQDPVRVMAYYGYGTPQKISIKGRVLQDEGLSLREENAPIWKNLLNMYRRFETDEVPDAQVQVQIGEQRQQVTTDDEGYFDAELELTTSLESDRLWQPVKIKLLSHLEYAISNPTAGEAIVISERAQFGVISDIDDTVMHTAANDPLKMIRIAYLGNERTRRPFKGVPEFYQALQRGQTGNKGNPIFYVSSSAWNMYDLFAKFMEFNDVPKGPIFLREIELAPDNLLSFKHRIHKRSQICPILEQFPNLPFILIGDTGQDDAEIYQQLAQEYPGQIWAIYLRDVTPNNRDRAQQLDAIGKELQQQDVKFLVFPHTTTAAQHAARHGWIAARNYW